jgi:acyl-CoA dehydrogenase family member 9
VPVRSPEAVPFGQDLARLIRRFHVAVDRELLHHREAILDRQYVQERIARAAMELFASACVLSRWDAELQAAGADSASARLFLCMSFRRCRSFLNDLWDNDDEAVTAAADAALARTRKTVLH